MKKAQTTIVELYDIKRVLLTNRSFFKNILLKSIDVIEMTKLGNPKFEYDDDCKKKSNIGLSGFVFIKESHVAFHSFPYRRYLKFVVSSCKKFKKKKLINFLKSEFQTENIETLTVYSGIHI